MGARNCSRVVSWLALLLPIGLLAQDGSWSRPLIIEESQRLTSPDPRFPLNGPAAIDGNMIVAGSSVFDETSPGFRCLVFLFERSGNGSFSYTRTLADFTVSDDRGVSHLNLDVAGDTVAVGASNRAFVIVRTDAGWVTTELARPAAAQDYGSDIATNSGNTVVGGTSGGKVGGFVFRRNEQGAWPFEAVVLAGGLPVSSNDYLGPEVDIGPALVIGSPQEFGPPVEPGRLYVFEREEDGSWPEIERLSGATSGAGRLAAIGTGPGRPIAFDNGLPGGARVFWEEDGEPDDWVLLDSVQALDSLMSGHPPALDMHALRPDPQQLPRMTLALGLESDEDRGPNTGSVTLWQPTGGDFFPPVEFFAPIAKLLASDATPGLALGIVVGFNKNGNEVVARGGNRVYVFRPPASLAQPELMQDDFEDGNAAGWLATSAGWSVVTSRGSRVYRQVRENFDTRSTLTNVDWTNVAIEADVRPLLFNGADRFAALMTRYTDDRNYYYLSLRSSNTLRLVRKVNGTNKTLASTSLAVPVNRSYRVRLEAIGTWLRVYVDGRLRLQARNSTLTHGTVGLRSYFARAEFDNVVVSPGAATTLLADAFDGSLSKWTLQPTGNWSIVGSGSTAVLRQSVRRGRRARDLGNCVRRAARRRSPTMWSALVLAR